MFIKELLYKYAEDLIDSPDAVGEVLRRWAFVCEKGEYGCYSSFDVIPEFTELKDEEKTALHFKRMFGRPFDSRNGADWCDSDSDIMKSIRYFIHPTGIEMGWYWDGDGVLTFYVPEMEDDLFDGTISNSDCKKSYGWEFGYKGD